MNVQPHYLLDTLPDPAWPQLFAVPSGTIDPIPAPRVEVPRTQWGHTIADARAYVRASGFTRQDTLSPGLYAFYKEG